jgi:hypothetical protein
MAAAAAGDIARSSASTPSAESGSWRWRTRRPPAGLDDVALHWLDPSIPVDLSMPVVRREISVALEILERYVDARISSHQ